METKLGIARVDITPLKPLPLRGFYQRKGLQNNGVCEKTNRPLYLNAWLFEQSAKEGVHPTQFVLIQADFLCWPSERLEDIHSAVRDTLKNPDAAVVLNASHTHSGPQTTLRYATPNEQNVVDYINFVIEKVKEAVLLAQSNLEPTTMYRGSGTCGFSVYRRKEIDSQIAMAPNEEVPIDQVVTVLKFVNDSGATKGVLFHYTCHPTTTDDNAYSSEYPGAAVEHIEQQWGEQINATFLQGCTGDVKPNLQREGQFYHGSVEEVDRFGHELANEVLGIMNESMAEVPWVQLESQVRTVELAFQHVPDEAELLQQIERGGRSKTWAHELLNKPERRIDSIPMRMTLVRLGDNTSLLTFDAEIVQEYGAYVRQVTRGETIPLGYTDGMIGYVPTAMQIDEGGYESGTAYIGFVLPSPFKREVEEEIKKAIDAFFESS